MWRHNCQLNFHMLTNSFYIVFIRIIHMLCIIGSWCYDFTDIMRLICAARVDYNMLSYVCRISNINSSCTKIHKKCHYVMMYGKNRLWRILTILWSFKHTKIKMKLRGALWRRFHQYVIDFVYTHKPRSKYVKKLQC